MNYAIETLQREISTLQRCLSEWESKEYPEAKKEREKRLNELNEALSKLSQQKLF